MKRIVLALLALLAIAEAQTTTRIGELRLQRGSIKFDLERSGTSKRLLMFVADEYVIDSVLLELELADAKKLRSILDAAILARSR